jgi:hypothetical protein
MVHGGVSAHHFAQLPEGWKKRGINGELLKERKLFSDMVNLFYPLELESSLEQSQFFLDNEDKYGILLSQKGL